MTLLSSILHLVKNGFNVIKLYTDSLNKQLKISSNQHQYADNSQQNSIIKWRDNIFHEI